MCVSPSPTVGVLPSTTVPTFVTMRFIAPPPIDPMYIHNNGSPADTVPAVDRRSRPIGHGASVSTGADRRNVEGSVSFERMGVGDDDDEREWW